MSREVTLKVPLVHRHRLDPGASGVAFHAHDPIDHEEWVSMRQKFHDVVDVEYVTPLRRHRGRDERHGPRVLLRQCTSQFSIRAVTWLHSDNMSPDCATEEREVTYDI